LGHAEVLTFDPDTGHTRYYEYGRYDDDFGQVKRRQVPDLRIGPDGQPTPDSWKSELDFVSRKFGNGRSVKTECKADSDFNRANDFAERRMNDKNRKPYSWNPLRSNHCKSFAREAVEAGRR
jgi:hypothetical protein